MSNKLHFFSTLSGTVCVAAPIDIIKAISDWENLRHLMAKQVPEGFSRDEWAYLISFLDRQQLESIYLQNIGKLIEGMPLPVKRLLRTRGIVAIWLPNNVSLLGPLLVVLCSLSGNAMRIKGGSQSDDLKHLGATVIGTVGSDEKVALARANGCDHVIVYTREDFVERVREITGRRGLRVVYDGVGKDTFAGSLDCLQPRGLLVMFGQSSGMVPPFDLGALSVKGSLYVTRPTLGTYAATPEALRRMAGDLFGVVRSGAVRILPPRQFSLREAGAAHAALEARATTGSIVLVA